MSLAQLPFTDPGTPHTRSPRAYLSWVARQQAWTLSQGVFWGIVWMGAQGAVPAVLGFAIGAAASGDLRRTSVAAAVVLALGIVQTAAGVLRHRMAVTNWINAASRTQQLVVRQATGLGSSLSREVSTGEVVAVTSSDVERIGSAFDVLARLAGAVVAFVAVAVLLLWTSPLLGMLVLVGAPLLAAGVAPLVGPLERRESLQRERMGRASALAADTVAGLRVLRGIGGEDLFVARYRDASQDVRRAAVGVAGVRSVLDALQVALPGALVVAVTWIGARQVAAGTLTVGQLVAFYAYTVFLVIPLRTFIEAAQRWTSAYVSARRVVALLTLERPDAAPRPPGRPPDFATSTLVDTATGLHVTPGRLTGVVCTDPATAAVLADRLGGLTPGDVRAGGVPLSSLAREDVRRAVLVQDTHPALLSGTLGDHFAVPRSGRVTLAAAIEAAAADDVLESVVDADPLATDALSARITERGRSLSGGQRQRLALARSLLVDPALLVLDEPTSAVDSHTEARIAAALPRVRGGRTTVVLTSSPLLLDACDEVALVGVGGVVAVGRHRALLREDPAYRAAVVRQQVSA